MKKKLIFSQYKMFIKVLFITFHNNIKFKFDFKLIYLIKKDDLNTINDEEFMTEYEKNERDAKNGADTESQIVGVTNFYKDSNKMNHIPIENNDYLTTKTKIESFDIKNINKKNLIMPKLPISFLIIDCSPINFIDTVGVKTMKQVFLYYYFKAIYSI